MSSTLLRVGLWILVLVLALYVIQQTFEESPVAEYVPMNMLQKALVVGGLLIAAGFVLRVFEKGAKAVVKNRCAVCRAPVPKGAIYCREHLRSVLHDEDQRTHMTKLRR